jgi:hypothetical protein
MYMEHGGGTIKRERRTLPLDTLKLIGISGRNGVPYYRGIFQLGVGIGRFWFLNPVYNQQYSLDGGSARRKAATYTQNDIDIGYPHGYSFLEWD